MRMQDSCFPMTEVLWSLKFLLIYVTLIWIMCDVLASRWSRWWCCASSSTSLGRRWTFDGDCRSGKRAKSIAVCFFRIVVGCRKSSRWRNLCRWQNGCQFKRIDRSWWPCCQWWLLVWWWSWSDRHPFPLVEVSARRWNVGCWFGFCCCRQHCWFVLDTKYSSGCPRRALRRGDDLAWDSYTWVIWFRAWLIWLILWALPLWFHWGERTTDCYSWWDESCPVG